MNYLTYLIILFVALTIGCTNVTTMKIRQNKDGSISIDSGKDVKADQLYFERGDEKVFLLGYSSMANTDAINAQSTREVNNINAVSDAVLKALAAGAAAAAKGGAP